MTSTTNSSGGGGGAGGGGFLPTPGPGPALSPAFSTSTVTPSLLPKPRSHPLRAGSTKETTVINHVDKTILSINRRHAKKFSSAFDESRPDPDPSLELDVNASVRGQRTQTQTQTGNDPSEKESDRGYESFREVARDIEGLIDVLWVSGTPSLQIPYLISLAVLVNTYLPSYPFAAKATFRLLRKLDSFFASLILGEDAETGQPLSGFEGRRDVVSMTEKVRIKSIAEAGRVVVVEVLEGRGGDEDGDYDPDGAGVEDEDEDEDEDEGDMEDVAGRWEMETGRVYEKTIQLLGDELGTVGEGEFCDEDMAPGDNEDRSRSQSRMEVGIS